MITKNLGMLALAIYLILVGLFGIIVLLGVSVGNLIMVAPILALIAGILLLMGK
jgi:hypothetical protein